MYILSGMIFPPIDSDETSSFIGGKIIPPRKHVSSGNMFPRRDDHVSRRFVSCTYGKKTGGVFVVSCTYGKKVLMVFMDEIFLWFVSCTYGKNVLMVFARISDNFIYSILLVQQRTFR